MIKWIVILAIISSLGFGIKKYGDMRVAEVLKEIEISTMIENDRIKQLVAEDKLQKAIISNILENKKNEALKEINYDKNSSVSIDSTRYYINF